MYKKNTDAFVLKEGLSVVLTLVVSRHLVTADATTTVHETLL